MIKFFQPIGINRSKFSLNTSSKILSIGSCFSDNIAVKLKEADCDILANPFGTMYNPVSICNSIHRIASAVLFTEDDCVKMGANTDYYCSFYHHTSFARKTKEEFLDNANNVLLNANLFWQDSEYIIITLGTSWVYRHIEKDEIVSNCLKIDNRQFARERLSVSQIVTLLSAMIARYDSKKFIFTVSPIRHYRDGAHENNLSKSILLLAIEALEAKFPDRLDYFPSYEIMLDELRDYRFYAEDLQHPSNVAVNHIWDSFKEFCFDSEQQKKLLDNEKLFKQSLHRKMLK